ncbi:MAG TPA: hypothetical protein VMW43_09635 [Bacteroidota bacterium]|nr:hypothetical protein [Bacteroidota bacterium]
MSKKAKRILAKLNDKRLRDNILESLNRDTLDEGAEPVKGNDQEMEVLKEMNELENFERKV